MMCFCAPGYLDCELPGQIAPVDQDGIGPRSDGTQVFQARNGFDL